MLLWHYGHGGLEGWGRKVQIAPRQSLQNCDIWGSRICGKQDSARHLEKLGKTWTQREWKGEDLIMSCGESLTGTVDSILANK